MDAVSEPASIAHETIALLRCDREPIHVPGAVQGHGGLLAIDPADGRIAFCSDNVAALLGLAAGPLGASVEDVLGAGSMERLADAVDGASLEEITKLMTLATDQVMAFTTHRSDDLIVVEIEAPEAPDARDALLHEVRRAVQRVEATDDAATACEAAVDEVRRITGYDRVMVYRFHEDEHGEVIAEARRPDIEPFLGLHYPATDIPRPARRLLRLSPTRMIGDVDRPPVPIVGHGAHAGRQLDLSRSVLRAVSPIHLQYLRNMGVAASLTISLTDGPRLWGLLACHHGDPRVASPELRSACAIVARTLWQRVDAGERLDQHLQAAQRLSLRARFLANVSSVDPVAEALVADGRFLLDLVAADGVCLRIEGVTTTLGEVPAREQLSTLVGQLSRLEAEPPIVTDEIGALGPQPWTGSQGVAGLIAAPLSPGWDEYVIWFRGEAVRTVTWAGDPRKPAQEAPAAEGGDLGPRTSFAAWRETMRGRSTAWNGADAAAATDVVAAIADLRASRVRDALAKRAMRDALTGLPNRALLLDRLDVAIADLARTGGRIWVMFLDLDGFKEVNDTLGHEAGDRLLTEVARRLRGGIRASDTAARLGGDEFVVVCAGDATEAGIDRLAAQLLAALAEPIVLDGHPCTIHGSIGIAAVGSGTSSAAAVAAADAAMYRAKRAGRNRAAR